MVLSLGVEVAMLPLIFFLMQYLGKMFQDLLLGSDCKFDLYINPRERDIMDWT